MFRFLVLISCVLVCQGKIDTNEGFNTTEKQRMLDLHNHFRAWVAQGKERDQPNGGDMMAMSWDDALAQKAQLWANKCFEGDSVSADRMVQPYRHVGQNSASLRGITAAVKEWYDEVSEFDYVNGNICSGVCGHYTQIVFWNSWKLGCGYKKCGDVAKIYCNYALGGNTVGTDGKYMSIYINSPACSKCPNGFGFCMNKALCELCQDTENNCDGIKQGCKWDSDNYTTTIKTCKKTCDACGSMSDVKAANSVSIITNVHNLDKDVSCVNKATHGACEAQPNFCEVSLQWAKIQSVRMCGICDPGTPISVSSGQVNQGIAGRQVNPGSGSQVKKGYVSPGKFKRLDHTRQRSSTPYNTGSGSQVKKGYVSQGKRLDHTRQQSSTPYNTGYGSQVKKGYVSPGKCLDHTRQRSSTPYNTGSGSQVKKGYVSQGKCLDHTRQRSSTPYVLGSSSKVNESSSSQGNNSSSSQVQEDPISLVNQSSICQVNESFSRPVNESSSSQGNQSSGNKRNFGSSSQGNSVYGGEGNSILFLSGIITLIILS